MLVGIARSVSEEPEPPGAGAGGGVTLGGKVPIPATTGAILSAGEAEEGAGVASEAVPLVLEAEQVTSVGLTTGAGVGGDTFDCWNGWGELDGGRKAC